MEFGPRGRAARLLEWTFSKSVLTPDLHIDSLESTQNCYDMDFTSLNIQSLMPKLLNVSKVESLWSLDRQDMIKKMFKV